MLKFISGDFGAWGEVDMRDKNQGKEDILTNFSAILKILTCSYTLRYGDDPASFILLGKLHCSVPVHTLEQCSQR